MAKAHEAASDWEVTKHYSTKVPTEPAEIDAEIVACEKRLELLRAAQRTGGVKQEFPKWVYKGYESKLVNSQEELDKAGAGWGEKEDALKSVQPKGGV